MRQMVESANLLNGDYSGNGQSGGCRPLRTIARPSSLYVRRLHVRSFIIETACGSAMVTSEQQCSDRPAGDAARHLDRREP